MSKEFFIKFTLRSRINKVLFVLVVDDKTKDCNINKLQLCFDCDSSMILEKLFENCNINKNQSDLLLNIPSLEIVKTS